MTSLSFENESKTSSPKRRGGKISPADRFQPERSSLRSVKSTPPEIHVKPKKPLRKARSLPLSNTEDWNKEKEDLRKRVLLKMDETIRQKREKEAARLIEEQRREENLRKEKEEKREKLLKLQAIRGQMEEEKTLVHNVVSHINDDKEEEKLFMKLFIKKMLTNSKAKMVLQNFVIKYKQSQSLKEEDKLQEDNTPGSAKVLKIFSDTEGKMQKFTERGNSQSSKYLPDLEKKPVFRTSSADETKNMTKQELRQYVQALHKIVDDDIKNIVKGQKEMEKGDKSMNK